MEKKYYRYCTVPMCRNTSVTTPSKIFFAVPRNSSRKKWCQAMRREEVLSDKASVFCCEDHFSLPDDMENYYQYILTKNVGKLMLKKGVVPHIFACQNRQLPVREKPAAAKRKRLQLVEDAERSLCEKAVLESLTPTEVVEPALLEEIQEPVKVDKAIQVEVKAKYRSVGTMSKPEVFSRGMSTDSIHRESVGTSPMKTKFVSFVDEVAEPENCQISDSEYACKDDSDYDTQCDKYEMSSDYSTDDEEGKKNFQLHMLQGILTAIRIESKLYLGIPKSSYFLISLLEEICPLPVKNILVTLKKIRLNDSFAILGVEFGMSKSNAGRIFKKSILLMSHQLQQLILWPDWKKIRLHLPIPFRSRYNKVQAIIDCLEIEIEKPTNPVHQALTWSEYKKCNTVKYLISCTPDGLVTFISPGYGGRASDVTIFEDCGFLENLGDGISVMADRGFKNVSHLLEQRGCSLVRPPSVQKDVKSSHEDVKLSKRIAALRIHVERVIGRLREFKMLLPHACIDNHTVCYMDHIVKIACGIINMQGHIIKLQF